MVGSRKSIRTGWHTLSRASLIHRKWFWQRDGLVNLPGILDSVRDGDLLEVDGGTGRVTLFREKS
jgi:hypothetical protein